MSLMNSAGDKSTSVRAANFESLQKAAKDFRYLLNRGYPRKASLELVGNRYELTFDERHLLHRFKISILKHKKIRNIDG